MNSGEALPPSDIGSRTPPETRMRSPGYLATARVLLSLTWARTVSPALLLAVLALVLLPMVFALMFASRGALSGDPVPFLVARFDQLVFALATPLIALLLGTSAFTAEAEDGTLLYLVTTRTPRWWIAFVRVLFAAVLTALLSALAIYGTGFLVLGNYDRDSVTRASTIAAAFGGAVYASFFTALSLLTRRALVFGLGYVLFWEGLLSVTFPGINYLSIRQWTMAVAASISTADGTSTATGPSTTVAFVGGALVVLLAVATSAIHLAKPRIGRT